MRNNLEMKLQHLYIKKVIMPKRKNWWKKQDEEREEFDPVKYLKSLDLEDFLKCEDTNNILITEHYENFEKKLKPKLEYLYERCNNDFRDYNLFDKDSDNMLGECFAIMIYNYINVKYDLEIFYECPSLAINLFESEKYK